ncbi:hypothetical protein NA57DRAFT_75705 [Rhizodiscina lignyota]|uniref:Uncharacterized protein n=1 Tax=Rhizodiscina lignyota TaxID=1504668 RepID=A0A9P4IHT5_9PEZI|nr:hypothetical protein NA57DRAFT_75705 [Rhizodiscina lignyota]
MVKPLVKLPRRVSWTPRSLLSPSEKPPPIPDIDHSLPASIFSNSADHEQKRQRPIAKRHQSDSRTPNNVAVDHPSTSSRQRPAGTTMGMESMDDHAGTSALDLPNSVGLPGNVEVERCSDKDSFTSNRTNVSRKILHGLPDMRMFDFARSVSKVNKDPKELHDDLNELPATGTQSYPVLTSAIHPSIALAESQNNGGIDISGASVPSSKPRPGHSSPGIRFQEPEDSTDWRPSKLSGAERRRSSTAEVPLPSGSSSDSGPSSRRCSGDDGERHSHFLHIHRHPRPGAARSTSSLATSASSSSRRMIDKNLQTMPPSPALVAHSPVLLARTATPPPDPASPMTNPTQDVVSPKSKRPKRFFKALAGMLSPNPRPELERSHSSLREKPSARKVSEDYFNQMATKGQGNITPEIETYHAGEATRFTTPLHLKRQYSPTKHDDQVFDYLPAEQRHSSEFDTSWHLQRSVLEDTGKGESWQGLLRSGGPLSDSALIPHRQSTRPANEDSLFRQRIDDIMGDDDEDESFDWDIPVHLPQSPLCPLNPKHKSGGKGVCVYHGRRKTQPTVGAGVESGIKGNDNRKVPGVLFGQSKQYAMFL